MKEVLGRSKKGQVTIFVILAIVIVVVGVLIYFFFPGIKPGVLGGEENPNTYLQNAIEDSLTQDVVMAGLNGGSLDGKNYPYFTYGGNNVEYLCYTNQPYATCTPQRALLIDHIESEIKKDLKPEIEDSFNQMKSDYQSSGYTVQMKRGDYEVSLLPKKVIVHDNTSLTLTKGDSVKTYNSFDVVINNNIYELASIARSIVAWEVKFGDSDPVYFMNFYPDIKIEKIQQSDGSKIYILTDRNTNDKFQFAVRSVVLPNGVPTP